MQTVTQGPLTLSLPSTLSPHAPHLLSPVLEALQKTWKTHIPTQNEKIRKRGWGTSTPKRDKKREKGRKKPTCEVLFVVLARNGEKKKHEEAAKCGGEKGGSEETAPGANCTKTSPRVSGGRTVIPAEQEREERP
ncbi:uncharacterized protein LOC123643736 isoform X2 [Lemur catta]|uniref:uncharacterized protein LOC123643736 isoform X2 n=1 Tax=Lemur catta TaxID=9447 RepID=UPI001E26907E|nr:uncharacterized protein LOC123643736 isoform X2 [Lemur catta]